MCKSMKLLKKCDLSEQFTLQIQIYTKQSDTPAVLSFLAF